MEGRYLKIVGIFREDFETEGGTHSRLQTNCNEYRIHYPLSFLVASYQRRQPPPLLPTTRSTSDFRAFARACISDAAIILTRLTRFRY